MSEISDTSKKIAALGIAGTVAVTGGVAAIHNSKQKEPEYLEPTTILSQEHNELMNTSNEYTIAGKTYVVEDPSSSIFGTVTENRNNVMTSQSNPTETPRRYQISPDRIVQDSKFADLDELYNYYLNVWNEKSAGRTPLEIIGNVANEEIANDYELRVAAALIFLANQIEQSKNINDIYQENKDYMKLIQLLVLPGNSSEHLDQNIMADLEGFWNLFPEEFKNDYNYQCIKSCFILLANEFTSLVDVKINGKAAVTYNGVYLTVELANLASNYNIVLHQGVLVCLGELDLGKDQTRSLKK